MKRIPLPNYSLSIALLENALRVMCLLPRRLGTLLASPSCSRNSWTPAPANAISAIICAGSFQNFLSPEAFPRGLVCTAGSVWSCCIALACPFPNRTASCGEKSRKPPPSHTYRRGRSHEKDPVGELLSEHCFAGKCSTSHVLDPGLAWERPL